MKKKLIIVIAAVLFALAAIYFIVPGFLKVSTVYIEDFSVSDDGGAMSVRIGTSSSVGHVRKLAVRENRNGRLYLDCYAAFGGINGSIGAKNEYIIPLEEDTDTIALLREGGKYEDVLKKDGEWDFIKK